MLIRCWMKAPGDWQEGKKGEALMAAEKRNPCCYGSNSNVSNHCVTYTWMGKCGGRGCELC